MVVSARGPVGLAGQVPCKDTIRNSPCSLPLGIPSFPAESAEPACLAPRGLLRSPCLAPGVLWWARSAPGPPEFQLLSRALGLCQPALPTGWHSPFIEGCSRGRREAGHVEAAIFPKFLAPVPHHKGREITTGGSAGERAGKASLSG